MFWKNEKTKKIIKNKVYIFFWIKTQQKLSKKYVKNTENGGLQKDK